MADGMDVSELIRRTVQANAKFYKGWMDLSLEYIRGLSEIFGGAEPQPPAEAVDSGAGVLVLEGEEGTTVRGAFLVSNDLGRKLSCELYASEFTEPGGASMAVRVSFDPPTVELAPGEQRVVYATLPVEGGLAPGSAYTGAFALKDLPGFSVPVVLRRRFGLEESPAAPEQRPSEPTGEQAPLRTAGRKPSARRKRPPRQKE